MLQDPNVDLNACVMQLQAAKSFFERCRSDERLEVLFVATELVQKPEIPLLFEQQ